MKGDALVTGIGIALGLLLLFVLGLFLMARPDAPRGAPGIAPLNIDIEPADDVEQVLVAPLVVPEKQIVPEKQTETVNEQ